MKARPGVQALLEQVGCDLQRWAEALLTKHGCAYLTTPDDPTCEWETSWRVDDPRELTAELLRCQGLYYQVRTKGGKMHTPPGADRCESEVVAA